MDDTEVIRIAAFKLGEGADRMAMLSTLTASPRLRRRLMALSNLLARQKQILYHSLEAGRRTVVAPDLRRLAINDADDGL